MMIWHFFVFLHSIMRTFFKHRLNLRDLGGIARTVYKAYMAHRHLIEIAINEYSSYSFASE